MKPLSHETKNLEQAAHRLLSLALKGGAEQAEVCASYSTESKIILEKQDYHLAAADNGYQLGLRTVSSKHQGFASCNSTEDMVLKETARKAVEIGSISPENPYFEIGSTGNIPKESPQNHFDEQLFNLSFQTQKEWTKLLVDEATKDPRIKISDGSLEIGSNVFLVLSSKGTHKIDQSTTATWGLMGMGIEGENITSFDHFYRLGIRAKNLPEKIVASSREFSESLLKALKNGPAKSYNGLVVFSPKAVGDILLSPLCFHLNGRNVVEKLGRWNKDNFNKTIINESITIEDNPWLEDRLGATAFDREGTPTFPMFPIQNGNLRGFFLDRYAALALSLAPTGHALGSANSAPTAGPHCLKMSGGEKPFLSLMKEVTELRREFLLVHRFSGQTDPITGDFSGVAKGADWWVAGERAYTVKETLISGNLFESMGNSLFGLSRETHLIDSHTEAPYLVADKVSVTSG